MIKSESQNRNDIIEVCKRIYANGWVAANDGNVSIKISQDVALCTPTGMSKGFLTSDQLIKVDMDGNKLEGELEPSSEIKMHLDVFKNKPGVNSVVHAHPPYATGFAVAGIPLDECVMPEIIIGLGSIPLARFGTPSTMEIPESIQPYLQDHNVFLLENHGALSVGSDVFQAYYRMESLELYSKVNLVARLLGNVNVLSEDNVKKLLKVREDFGLSSQDYPGCRVDDRYIGSHGDCAVSSQQTVAAQKPQVLQQPLVSQQVPAGNSDKIEISRKELAEIITTVVKNIIGK